MAGSMAALPGGQRQLAWLPAPGGSDSVCKQQHGIVYLLLININNNNNVAPWRNVRINVLSNISSPVSATMASIPSSVSVTVTKLG